MMSEPGVRTPAVDSTANEAAIHEATKQVFTSLWALNNKNGHTARIGSRPEKDAIEDATARFKLWAHHIGAHTKAYISARRTSDCDMRGGLLFALSKSWR